MTLWPLPLFDIKSRDFLSVRIQVALCGVPPMERGNQLGLWERPIKGSNVPTPRDKKTDPRHHAGTYSCSLHFLLPTLLWAAKGGL